MKTSANLTNACLKITILLTFLGFSTLCNAVAILSITHSCDIEDFTTSLDCIGLFDSGNDHGTHDIFDSTELQDQYGTGWMEFNPSGLGSTGNGTTSGTWSVDTSAWNGLGTVLAVIKAGPSASAYEVDTSFSSGLWNISGSNWTDPDTGTNHAISHFGFWSTSNSIPEPNTLALLVLGVAGLGLWQNRRQQ